jgi:hypothetical protein
MYRNVKKPSIGGSMSLWISQHTVPKVLPTEIQQQQQSKRPLELITPPVQNKKQKKYQKCSNDE